jgi:hypothetical protein
MAQRFQCLQNLGMGTVTYLPTPTGFVLTHNRDEAPLRSPQTIHCEKNGRDTLLFPRDTKAGGAWIATSQSGKTACLLNGAFIKHHHEPPYRRSRGLMLLDFFDWRAPGDFFDCYEFSGIEPFTFLFFNREAVCELRWDGVRKHLKNLPPIGAYFWCSATLYPPDMQEKREQVFRRWLTGHPVPTGRSLLALHRSGSVGDPENDYIMNRGGRVCTVSITQVAVRGATARMQYFDLLEAGRDRRQITMSER